MGLAFGGKELIIEEDPNLNLRKIHYHLIRDKGLSLVSCDMARAVPLQPCKDRLTPKGRMLLDFDPGVCTMLAVRLEVYLIVARLVVGWWASGTSPLKILRSSN